MKGDLDTISLRKNPRCPVGDFMWKGYYWERPMEEPEYEEDYWGTVMDPDGHERNVHDDWDQRVEDKRNVYDFLEQVKPGKILDIGCGPGVFLSGLSEEWEKVGVDISKKALESCSRFAITCRGEFTNLKFADNEFDVISIQHVIEHLHDPISYVREICRTLRPGGILVLATPDFDCGCARFFGKNFRMLHDNGHISLFTSFSVVQMVEDYGFEVIQVDYPFFDTQWFTEANLKRMLQQDAISPPFYGNHVVVFCRNIKK